MIIVRIILAILAIIFCFGGAIAQFVSENIGYGLALLALGVFNIFLLEDAINDSRAKENNEPIATVVSDVAGYKVDSTIVINAADTTKTYTVTYWRYE